MKEKNKNMVKGIKITTIVLLIVLISMIGFLGIYAKNKNTMSNTVKDYTYAMDLEGARNIKLQLNTSSKEVIKDSEGKIIESATDEEIEKNGYVKEQIPNNSEDAKTEENYKKAKQIIEKRLDSLDVRQYNISLNSKTGEMNIQIPEDANTDRVVGQLNTVGKFEIIDSETKEVLMTNDDIKSSDVLYNTTSTGTGVYLEIAFNKEGKKKIEEISKTYVKSEDNNTNTENNTTTENVTAENATTENTTEEATTTEKKITMKIDDQEIMSTSFDETLTTGKIQLSVGQATKDTSTLEDYVTQAQSVATVLDSGNLPLTYDIEKNQYVLSEITEQQLGCIAIIIAVVLAIGIIILIVKYKLNGLLAGIAYVGLAALYTLLIRYTNVVISIESIFGIATTLILDYIFTILMLNNIKENIKVQNENVVNKSIINTYKKFFNRIMPICIIAVAFCFVKWIPISSFGMITFWGLAIIAVYNAIITRYLLKVKVESK